MDIKYVIQQRGLLMSQAAEMMGITPQALSQIVNGNPTVKKIEMLAKAIGCSPADFFQDWQTEQAQPADTAAEGESTAASPTPPAPETEQHDELPFSRPDGGQHPTTTMQQAVICPHCHSALVFNIATYEQK